MVRVHLFVSGTVQGVWFRASTREVAQKLNLHGWVRNRNDGRVEIVAEGPVDRVQKLRDWCHQGPPQAHVTQVEFQHEVLEGLAGEFDVRETV